MAAPVALLAACVALSGNAPGYSATNYSVFDPGLAAITADDATFTLKQFATPGIESYSGGCATSRTYGYGTYAFDAQVQGGSSGSVAEGFLYLPQSVTEIDVELWGGSVYFSNWTSETNVAQTKVPADASASHRYSFTWTPSSVSYAIDGHSIATHTVFIPSQPAVFRFDIHGTNNPAWGGLAVPGQTATLTIRNATFTPSSP